MSAWPASPGAMAARIRARNWAATPLGPIDAWPQSLKTAIELTLASPQPSYVGWGHELMSFYNDHYATLVGDEGQGTGLPYRELWPELWERFEPVLAKVLAGDAQSFVDRPSPRKAANGDTRFYNFTWSPLRDDGGAIAGFYGTGFETTGHVHTAARLSESEARFRTMAESIDDVFYLTDLDTRALLYLSPSYEVIWKRSARDLAADPARFVDTVHPEDREIIVDALKRQARAEPVEIEYRIILPNGEERWILDRSFPVSSEPGGRRSAGTARDITDRKAVEHALQASEHKYKALFENIESGFCIIRLKFDAQGQVIDYRLEEMNPAFAAQTGLLGAEGKWVSEVVPGLEQHWFDTYGKVARTGEGIRFENFAAPFDRWYDVYAFPAGEDDCVAISFTDITARRRGEATLRESEQRQAFLLAFSDALRAEAGPDAVADRAIRLVADHLRLDRCYLANYRVADDRADITHQVGNDRVAPMPDTIVLSDFPEAFQIVFDKTLVIDDILADKGLSQTDRTNISALGFGALMAPTLRKGPGRPLWALVAVSAVARRWTPAEIALAEEVAERTWLAVERARGEAASRESEARLQTLVAGIPQLVWRATDHGRWTWASPQWTDFTGQSEPASRDRGWLDALHPEDRESAMAAWALAMDRGVLEADYRLRRSGDGRYRWFQTRAAPVRDATGTIVEWLGTSTDVDDLRTLQEQQDVLVAELQHRTLNLMTVVRGVAETTLQSSDGLDDFRARYLDRLDALARVQRLLSQRRENERVTVTSIICGELQAAGAIGGRHRRVTVKGDKAITLRAYMVQIFAMTIHELTTNALKYGALKQPRGRLWIDWHVETREDGSRWLLFRWRERGVRVPASGGQSRGTGQGRRLIERALPHQLSADVVYVLGEEGLTCTMAIPMDEA